MARTRTLLSLVLLFALPVRANAGSGIEFPVAASSKVPGYALFCVAASTGLFK
ncbi:MAG TPA: hypothetical protein VNT76_18860 [Candidatus Binatus sp.]|nr:hypothetical protein [Candidatus Binatus sp.]